MHYILALFNFFHILITQHDKGIVWHNTLFVTEIDIAAYILCSSSAVSSTTIKRLSEFSLNCLQNWIDFWNHQFCIFCIASKICCVIVVSGSKLQNKFCIFYPCLLYHHLVDKWWRPVIVPTSFKCFNPCLTNEIPIFILIPSQIIHVKYNVRCFNT